MANIGDLAVDIRMRTAKFEQGVRKVNSRLGSLERHAKVASKTFGTMLGVGLTGAGIAGFVAATKSSLDFADSIDKTSRKLGVSAEALQTYRYAAGQSGVSTTTLDMALQRFTRRAAEAAVGTGEAKGALAELGIQLHNSDGSIRSTEALFGDAMKAIAGVNGEATQLRLGFKLFDSEGAALVNMAANFEALTKKARDLGLVMSQHTIKDAVKLRDDLDTLGKTVQLSVNEGLIDLAPLLVGAAQGFAEAARTAGDYLAKLKDIEHLNSRQTQQRLQETQDRINSNQKAFMEWIAREKERGSSFEEIQKNHFFGVLGKVIKDDIAKADELKRRLDDVQSTPNRSAPGAMAPGSPPAPATSAPAGSTSSLDSLREQALRAQNLEDVAEQFRYQKQVLALQDQRALLEEHGQLTQEIKDRFRQAEEDALTIHASKLLEIEQQREDEFEQIGKEAAEKKLAVEEQLANAKAQLIQNGFELGIAIAKDGSKAERALLAVQKGIALAQSMMAMQVAIAKANAVGWPANIPAIAQAVGIGASAIASIKSIQTGGVAHGGLDYVPKESTFLLDKGERVLSPRQNTDLTKFMAQNRSAPPVVNIHNYAGADVGVEKNGDVIDVVLKRVDARLSDQINRGTGISGTLQRAYGLTRAGTV